MAVLSSIDGFYRNAFNCHKNTQNNSLHFGRKLLHASGETANSILNFYILLLLLWGLCTWNLYLFGRVGFCLSSVKYPVRSCWSSIGRLPRWRIGQCSPDMAVTGEIKYPGRTKISTAGLQFDTGVSRARGRKP